VEDITFNLNVNTISEPFEVVFDARDCMALTVDSLKPFIVNSELNMNVKIRSFDKLERIFLMAAEEATEQVANTALQEHDQEQAGPDGKTRCPLFKIEQIKCLWLGSLESLQEHLENMHEHFIKRGPTLFCTSLTDTQFIILFNGEIFLYYKHVSDTGIMYVVVQQVGITDTRYQYKVEFNMPSVIGSKISHIIHTDMSNISESFEDIFKTRMCMSIQKARLAPFIKFNILFMKVTITEFRPRKRF
jgi:hypothetical protein